MTQLKPADKQILSEIKSKFDDLDQLYLQLSFPAKKALALIHLQEQGVPHCIHTGRKSAQDVTRAYRIR